MPSPEGMVWGFPQKEMRGVRGLPCVQGVNARLLPRRQEEVRPDETKCGKEVMEGECAICLGDHADGPLLRLDCNHIFHEDCIREQISRNWGAGARMSFGFIHCGLCRDEISHPRLEKVVKPFKMLKRSVTKLLLQQADADGLPAHLAKEHPNREEEVQRVFAANLCSQCSKPFCSGRIDCGGDDEVDPQTLVCGDCSFQTSHSSYKCHEHGVKYAIYKCDSCCKVATFDCRGNHFCDECHRQPSSGKNPRPTCCGRPEDNCPLGKCHPPNQPCGFKANPVGFVIGCTKCLGIDKHCSLYTSRTSLAAFNKNTTVNTKKHGLVMLQNEKKSWTINGIERQSDLEPVRLQLRDDGLHCFKVDGLDRGSDDKLREGNIIEARWMGGARFFPGRIHKKNADGTFIIHYHDGDKESHVPSALIRKAKLNPADGPEPFRSWVLSPEKPKVACWDGIRGRSSKERDAKQLYPFTVKFGDDSPVIFEAMSEEDRRSWISALSS